MTRSARLLPVLLLLVFASAPLRPLEAVSTATFKVSTFEEMDKGEPQGAFVSSEGQIVPGRGATRLKSTATMVFTSVRAADGTVYLGTGDQAQLLAAKGDAVRSVADLKAVLITSLAIGPGGSVLAATMPDAKVVRVDPATGKWTQLAKLPTSHIWALLYDKKTRRVFVATGSPGKIFTIPEAGGTPVEYYDPDEKHLLCLARGPGGSLLAGSSDKAILYQVTAKGKARAVHDFDATELRDVVVGADGAIFVVANKFKLKTSGLPRFDQAKEGEDGTPVKASKEKSASKHNKVRPQELRPGAKEGKGAVYRLDVEGNAEQLLDLPKGYFTDLELDADGVLWAGDGTKGKVYMIMPDRSVLTAFDLAERQVLALAVAGKEQYMGTGDAGAVYRVKPGLDPKAAYLSEVFDGKYSSRWGNLEYRARGNLRVDSRSGNTAKPDKTWSGWKASGAAVGNTRRINSPAGRYLQLRFTLGAGARLSSFNAFYRPANQRARVTEIEVEREGSKDKDKAKKPRSPKLKITWKVDNPDNDTLSYRVYAREEMGLTWRLISGHDALEKAELEWDTEPVADGYYRIRVDASDEPANGPESTLVGKKISARLLVDNRKPDVLGLTARFPWVSGTARDGLSPIGRVEYSIDGGPWRLVDAADGIYDSLVENFRFQLPLRLPQGTHLIAVRAVDGADNMGVTQVNLLR